jgi:hypothetical protein
MKKILLGLVAAFALTCIAAPAARAEGEAGGDATKTDAPAKKGKKGKKGKKDAEGGEAPAGGDATKK